MASQNRRQIIIAVVVFLLILAILTLPELLTNYLWFKSLDYNKIFVVNLEAKLLLFFASAVIFFGFVMLNLWIATRSKQGGKSIDFKLLALISGVLAVILGRIASNNWGIFLRYLRQTSFDIKDPLFSKDLSFYIFTLPFLEFIFTFLLITVLAALIFALIYYFQSILVSFFSAPPDSGNLEGLSEKFNFKKELSSLKKRAKTHISILLGVTFLLIAFGHFIARYQVLYSERGAVVGAGYTEVNVILPVLNLLVFLALIMAVISFSIGFFKPAGFQKSIKYGGYVFIVYLIIMGLGITLLPSVIQSLVVSPNEFELEEPFLKSNINFTQEAYGLSQVEENKVNYTTSITNNVIDENPDIINNIRLLDSRPLKQTYKQTQEIRSYYDLSGIDIDRYNVQGEYTQVMLSPRELDQNVLQERAKTWVNNRLVFTHGYGIVMSPVNKITSEGMPTYLIKNIPPENVVNDTGLSVNSPQIYYGERTDRHVIVNSNTKEFDYPMGDKNVYMHYDGSGGIKLDSFFKKLLMSIKFFDIKILLSSAVDDESRIMYARNVQERISKLTPFIKLDGDPYVVLNDGKIYWMQDGYTTSTRYPYSENSREFNYIRNSVKIVVDAYSGEVDYYMVGNDPIMKTYAEIYPNKFKEMEDMPAGLKEHIRYPELLFRVQTQLYKTYHMNDPNVFYNREDPWEIPNEIYGTGEQIEVEPYYIMTRLPGKDKLEFLLMTSYTPSNKNNMIGWLGARCDGDNYGELILYKFPKDRVIYGPSQVEATIDQDSEISQQITLWSQRGSNAVRGNLLVVPINKSILYVEPLYLISENSNLPQLKRVIVSDGDQVVMHENLEEALEFMLLEDKKEKDIIQETNLELIETANEEYKSFLDSMQEQNWQGMGDSIEELGRALERLRE
ncbi:MAG: UPF0182 family protein [Candidatus Nanoarchaeia archaeon]